jgi:D-apionolactonase
MLTDIKQIWSGGKVQKPLLALKAGRLSLYYQQGNIRHISDGRNEVIRMIYSALRDREWLNINPVISSEKIQRGSDNFRIEYSCTYFSDKPLFHAVYIIEGKSDNTITFSFEGEALNTFEKNRLGFCVLHPVKECSGKPCELTHSSGSKELLSFPSIISPDQLFLDVKAMKWDNEDSECLLEFTGDIFETEDQRNWTDASFKTYCTPLSLPIPVKLIAGDKISQKIKLKVTEKTSLSAIIADNTINITFEEGVKLNMPETGIGRSTRVNPLTENESQLLKLLHADHYRYDIYLFENDWITVADKALAEARTLGCKSELALFFDDNFQDQTVGFIKWIAERKPEISVIILLNKTAYVTPDELLKYASHLIRQAAPSARISYGTNANFTEINRERPSEQGFDLLTYSIHPQEHASDNLTLIENLEAQKYTVESAAQFSNGKGIRVSPVNLQRRFNANIQNFETKVTGSTFPFQVDSRIMSLFGACWTAGSIKYLSESGAEGITYYEAAGERGIIQGDFDSGWPDNFKSKAGMIFPVFHILKWFLECKTFSIIRSRSSSPLKVDVLAMVMDRKIRFVLINYTHHFQNVTIKINSGILNSFTLETESFTAAASDPEWLNNCTGKETNDLNNLSLSPYSLTFMEGDLLDYNLAAGI